VQYAQTEEARKNRNEPRCSFLENRGGQLTSKNRRLGNANCITHTEEQGDTAVREW